MSSPAVQAAYRKTPQGVAAAKRSHDNYTEKRKQYKCQCFDTQILANFFQTGEFKMIDWISTSTSGRNTTQYIAAVIGSSKEKLRDRDIRQIALRFSQQAQKDLRLIPGDRISIGFDDVTKQICFKRTTDGGYKLTFSTALKPGETASPNAILVVAATTLRPVVSSVQYHKDDVVVESSHISINAPEFFGE